MEFIPVIISFPLLIVMKKVVIIGGGIAGCAAAILLAKLAETVEVEIYEQQGEETQMYGGRSLNITICTRGWSVLEAMGCIEELKKQATLMTFREVHLPDGSSRTSPYDVHNKNNGLWAISRSALVSTLRAEAERRGVKFHYGFQFISFDKLSNKAFFISSLKGQSTHAEADLFIGADGAYSPVRSHVLKQAKGDVKLVHSPYRYLEVSITSPSLTRSSMHSWPTGGKNKDAMLLAMPNHGSGASCDDSSFAGSLFYHRDAEYEVMQDPTEWISSHFCHPSGTRVSCPTRPGQTGGVMVTVESSAYYHSNVVLIGDAAHCMVPFAGQGANSALEDCRELVNVAAAYLQNGGKLDLEGYFNQRKVHVDAISLFARQNFDAMRKQSTLSRNVLRLLQAAHALSPSLYSPPHVGINFSLTPYATVITKSDSQYFRLLSLLGCMLVIFLIALFSS